MKNNSRYLLLEYLYSLQLPQISQMTLCFWDQIYQDHLAKHLLPKDLVTVYHAKGLRVFSKSYPKAEISDTIIDFAVEMKEKMVLSYSDFTYAIKDPYYRKDMRDLSFTHLLMVPIENLQQSIIGVAFFYFNEAFGELDKIDVKALRKLIDSLVSDEEVALTNTLWQQVLQENSLPFALDVDNFVYLSTALMQLTNQSNQLIDLDTWNTLLKNHPTLKQTKQSSFLGKTIYYYSDNSLNVVTKKPIYAFEFLNQHGFANFTVIYFQYRGWEEKVLNDHLEYMEEVLPALSENPMIYKVNDDTLVYLIPEIIDKRLLAKMEGRIKDYRLLYLRSERDFPSKLDLKPIVEYLNTTDVSSFVLSQYYDYRTKQNEQKYLIEALKDNRFNIKTSKIINSQSEKELGTYLTMEIQGIKLTPDFQEFQIIKMMQYLLNEKIAGPILAIDAILMRKRAIWNYLKKLSDRYPDNLTVIVRNYSCNVEMVSEYCHRLQQLGLKILVDQSIYSSIAFYSLFPLYTGIVIDDFSLMETEYGQAVLKFYLERGKQIIILHATKQYQHKLIYCISK